MALGIDVQAWWLGMAGLAAGVGVQAIGAALWRRRRNPPAQPRAAPDARDPLAHEVDLRRRAERVAFDLEQTLAVSLACIDAGTITADRAGRVTDMNAAAERVTGWPRDEALGRSLWQVFARTDRPADLEQRNPVDVMIEQGVQPQQAHHVQARSRLGELRPLEVHAAPTRDGTGTVNGLVMVFRDMTRTHHAEAEMARLAALVASSSDAIVSKTLDGRITSWNGAAERLFGYTSAEALGMAVQRLIPPERLAEEMRILADLAHGRTVPAFDTVRVAKGGRRVEVSITISPIRDAAGRIVGGSKIARDITERRRMEAALHETERARLHAEQLEAENRRILEASRLKGQFLANMSHELRTPLNAIIGFAELLQGPSVPPGSARHHEYLGHVANSGRHLLKLINDVLDLSKVEAGRVEFQPEPVDLAALMTEVTGVLQAGLLRKQIELSVDIAPGIGALVLDPSRLRQVLYNYLSNAIKFTPERGHVAVRARPDGARCFRVEVEDDGPGIAADDLPRLFVEFQQLDSSYTRRHQGTGLGLALTRRLVQAQGGDVGVRSRPGVGSVFHFVLPCRPFTGPDDSAPAQPRVLVIEADVHAQAQLSRALGEAGFAADEAGTGDHALQQASRHGYHAITLGLHLPDQQGLQALAHIRTGGLSHASPVVGMTMPALPGRVAGFGIADVLFKPLRSHEVARVMSRFARGAGQLPARVLVIDDDPLARDLMSATLVGLGIETVCRADGRHAVAELDAIRPDALVLDLMMPEFDGFAVLDALHEREAWRALPVFVWTSMILTDEEFARLARSARAIVGKGGGAVTAVLHGLLKSQALVP